jgi:hypothetical protein
VIKWKQPTVNSDDVLWGQGTVWIGWWKPTFQRSELSPSGLKPRWTQHASPKRSLLPTNSHGSLTQNSIIRTVTAVKILRSHDCDLINHLLSFCTYIYFSFRLCLFLFSSPFLLLILCMHKLRPAHHVVRWSLAALGKIFCGPGGSAQPLPGPWKVIFQNYSNMIKPDVFK